MMSDLGKRVMPATPDIICYMILLNSAVVTVSLERGCLCGTSLAEVCRMKYISLRRLFMQ